MDRQDIPESNEQYQKILSEKFMFEEENNKLKHTVSDLNLRVKELDNCISMSKDPKKVMGI